MELKTTTMGLRDNNEVPVTRGPEDQHGGLGDKKGAWRPQGGLDHKGSQEPKGDWDHNVVAITTGADPGILVRGGVKVARSTDRQNLFFKCHLFYRLNTFRYTKPEYLHCMYSGVSKKWSAIFVRCIVPEISFYF